MSILIIPQKLCYLHFFIFRMKNLEPIVFSKVFQDLENKEIAAFFFVSSAAILSEELEGMFSWPHLHICSLTHCPLRNWGLQITELWPVQINGVLIIFFTNIRLIEKLFQLTISSNTSEMLLCDF